MVFTLDFQFSPFTPLPSPLAIGRSCYRIAHPPPQVGAVPVHRGLQEEKCGPLPSIVADKKLRHSGVLMLHTHPQLGNTHLLNIPLMNQSQEVGIFHGLLKKGRNIA